MPEMLNALERCATLLDAVVRFMEENPLAEEFYVHYDEADCDGACLRDDCRIALDEVNSALSKVEGR